MDIQSYDIEPLEETIEPASGGEQPLLGTLIALGVIYKYY